MSTKTGQLQHEKFVVRRACGAHEARSTSTRFSYKKIGRVEGRARDLGVRRARAREVSCSPRLRRARSTSVLLFAAPAERVGAKRANPKFSSSVSRTLPSSRPPVKSGSRRELRVKLRPEGFARCWDVGRGALCGGVGARGCLGAL